MFFTDGKLRGLEKFMQLPKYPTKKGGGRYRSSYHYTKGDCNCVIVRLSNLAQRYEGGKEYPELFISNYDTREFLNSCVQMSLFKEYTNQLIGERNIIYDRINEIHSCTTGNI